MSKKTKQKPWYKDPSTFLDTENQSNSHSKTSTEVILDELSSQINKNNNTIIDHSDLSNHYGIFSSPGDTLKPFTTSKHVSSQPTAYRRARYPNGRVVLQVGYTVTIGFAGSYIEWTSMEPVDVDDYGLTQSDREAMVAANRKG